MEFNGYQILGKLLETYHFDFYEAKNLRLDTVVVIKALKDKFVHDEKLKREFICNVREMAKVKFAFTPEIYDIIDDGENCYASLEYSIVAPTITRTVNRQKKVDQEDVLMIAAWLSQSLSTSWNSLKLSHKELTPEKIAIQEDGTLVLFDLGTTKNTEPSLLKPQIESQRLSVQPYFLAPEQIDCEEPSDKTDMYAMGMILYYMLTGVAPFSDYDPMDVLHMHKTAQVASPSQLNPSITHQMELLLAKLTMKASSDRFYTWSDVCHAISLIRVGKKIGITVDRSECSIKVSDQKIPDIADFEDRVEPKDFAGVRSTQPNKKVIFDREHARRNRNRRIDTLVPDIPIPLFFHLFMVFVVVVVWLLIAGIVNYRYLSNPVFEQKHLRMVVQTIMPEK